MIVGILGENRWGQSLARLVAEAGHIPKIGKEPESSFRIRGFGGSPHWSTLSKQADLIIFANPTRQLLADLKRAELGPRNHVLVSAGLHTDSQLWTRQVVGQHTPAIRVGILGGAQMIEEIEDRIPTSMVVASDYDAVNNLTHQCLHSDICRMYFSEDIMGVDIATLFVPVIQLAMGIADALECGSGTRGAIVSRGLIEGARLGTAMGASEHSFLGMAGIGQLVSTFQGSVFYQYGKETIQQNNMPTVAIQTLSNVLQFQHRFPVHLPLTKAIYALGQGKIDGTLLIDGLMRRSATKE